MCEHNVQGRHTVLGCTRCFPFLERKWLVQEDDEPLMCYACAATGCDPKRPFCDHEIRQVGPDVMIEIIIGKLHYVESTHQAHDLLDALCRVTLAAKMPPHISLDYSDDGEGPDPKIYRALLRQMRSGNGLSSHEWVLLTMVEPADYDCEGTMFQWRCVEFHQRRFRSSKLAAFIGMRRMFGKDIARMIAKTMSSTSNDWFVGWQELLPHC